MNIDKSTPNKFLPLASLQQPPTACWLPEAAIFSLTQFSHRVFNSKSSGTDLIRRNIRVPGINIRVQETRVN